ncbi:MAG TPA: hypothetical protein VGC63_08060 [Solirubrobacterales bacterium]|jgi:hypothetical protein
MTGSADFTAEEWDVVREGPTSAGMIVSTAQRGGTFREVFAMAKVYAEARKEHGTRRCSTSWSRTSRRWTTPSRTRPRS